MCGLGNIFVLSYIIESFEKNWSFNLDTQEKTVTFQTFLTFHVVTSIFKEIYGFFFCFFFFHFQSDFAIFRVIVLPLLFGKC